MTPPLLHPRRPSSLSTTTRNIYTAVVRTRPLAPKPRTHAPTPPSGIWGVRSRGVGVLVYRSACVWVAMGVCYVIGVVAGPIAGGAVTSSLLVAAVTSLITGFCYTELVTCTDQCSGQVYTATYQLVGEAAAYLVGMLYVLINASALAALGKALSSTMDYLCGGKVEKWVSGTLGHLPITDQTPDFIAAGACLSVAVILAIGLEQVGFLRAVMSVVTVLCLLFFLIVGGTHVEHNNTHLQHAFTTLGSSELLAGAAVCMAVYGTFYEAGRLVKTHRHPHRVLPLVISFSTGASFLAFFVLGIVLTLMTGNEIPPKGAPLIQAMTSRDVSWARLVIGCFQVVMVCLSLAEVASPLSRQLVSLASDGLFPSFLASQCHKTSAHSHAHLTGGSLAALIALTLNHVLLLQVLSTCVLLLHVVVVVTVLYRRHRCSYAALCSVAVTSSSRAPLSYLHHNPRTHNTHHRTFHFLKDGLRVIPTQLAPGGNTTTTTTTTTGNTDSAHLLTNEHKPPEEDLDDDEEQEEEEEEGDDEKEEEEEEEDVEAVVREYKKIQVATLGRKINKTPTPKSARVAILLLSLTFMSILTTALMIVYGYGRDWAIWAGATGVCVLVGVVSVTVLSRQPAHSSPRNAFSVPAHPWLPTAALMLNTTLLTQLLAHTWPVVVVILPAGMAWYFFYGLRHSHLGGLGLGGVGGRRGRSTTGGETILLEPLTPPSITTTPLQAPHCRPPSPPYSRLMTQVDAVVINS